MKDKPNNKVINCARTPEPAVRTEKLNQMKKDSSDKKLKMVRNDSRLLSSDKKGGMDRDRDREKKEGSVVESKMVENNMNLKGDMRDNNES